MVDSLTIESLETGLFRLLIGTLSAPTQQEDWTTFVYELECLLGRLRPLDQLPWAVQAGEDVCLIFGVVLISSCFVKPYNAPKWCMEMPNYPVSLSVGPDPS